MKPHNFRRRGLLYGGLGVALGLALAGCSPSSPEEPASSPTATATATEQPTSGATTTPATEAPTEEPTSDPEEPPVDNDWSADPQTVEANNAGTEQVITDFRVGSHDGYDRVVLELSGTDDPGWMINWVQRAHEQGRGEELDLEGPAFLDVNVMWVTYPFDEETEKIAYTGRGLQETGDIRAYFDSIFEGQVHLVIGMDQNRPYRVFTLSDPVRVVIDVQKP